MKKITLNIIKKKVLDLKNFIKPFSESKHLFLNIPPNCLKNLLIKIQPHS